MRVRVRLFARLRELAGGDIDTTVPGDCISVADFGRHIASTQPALAPYMESIAVAVNEQYVTDHTQLIRDGDEVALIQPIAGGAATPATPTTPHFRVTIDALDPIALRDLVRTDASGAVVLFEGTVRNHHEGHAVLRLEYDAYAPMAERQLRLVADEVRAAFPEVHAIAIHHRYGTLEIGEAAVIVAVSAGHRHEAFAAAERAMDRVKETVPVWKKEHGPDGALWQEGVAPVPTPRETGG